jgi:hypothetical protein
MKGSKGRGRLMERMNQTGIPYMYICKYHNEIPAQLKRSFIKGK